MLVFACVTAHAAPRRKAATGVRCKNDHCWITSASRDRLLGDLDSVMNSVRAVPHFADRQVDGWKLDEIAPGSIFALVGFDNGDVVHTINGVSVANPMDAMPLLLTVRSLSQVTVVGLHHGKPRTLELTVK